MRNIKLTVAYDGTDFHGFQVQPALRTVQGELEQAIHKLTGVTLQINGSGRTDAGVHARGQAVNFHTSSRIPVEKWPIAMNTVLPADVVIYAAEEVPPTFHSRYDAVGKVYIYQIDQSLSPDVFMRKYAWHVPYPLQLDSMREAASYFTGEHDFTSFCNVATPVKDKRRTIYDISVEPDQHILRIRVHGSGFLWNMVRILAGTIVDVGKGRIAPKQIPEILSAADRTKAGVTAPAHGLTLDKVMYDKPDGTQ